MSKGRLQGLPGSNLYTNENPRDNTKSTAIKYCEEILQLPLIFGLTSIRLDGFSARNAITRIVATGLDSGGCVLSCHSTAS